MKMQSRNSGKREGVEGSGSRTRASPSTASRGRNRAILGSLGRSLQEDVDHANRILEETKRVNSFEGEVRIQQLEVQSSKLALDERKLLMEGQRAMLLLQEEGSSTAFPEALQQMLSDIESVVERLQKADVGDLTIAIEEESYLPSKKC